MFQPSPPEALAALAALLDGLAPAGPALAMDAAEVHRDTRQGRHTTEAFGRYARVAVPQLLARLLAVETQNALLRAKVAGHAAAWNLGDDPTAGELLGELRRAGVDLGAEVTAAAAVLEAEAHAATFA